MKCKSVACIWSASPPVHRVTASAVLDHPPTLYTGGSDGSIIWWNLISSHEKQEIKPIAMLCGHAGPIADLRICFPAAGAGNGKSNNPSNVLSNSNSVGALISACTDGVLCIWSRAMGHCKRRRKLPPWVGSPSMLQPLPENGRYVCIACCFGDYDHLSLDPVEEAVTLVDKESQQGKPSKYTVVIVDSYTLTIVQTIFHGNLSIGPLKSLAIIVSNGEMEKWSVMIIDSFGKVQYLPILKNFDSKGETLSGTPEDSAHLEVMDCADGSKEKGLLVTFAKCGQVIALVYRTYCAFRLVDDHTILGKISFLDDQLCLGGKSHVVGGMFLGDDEATMRFKTGKSNYDFMEEFAVWNDRGSAVIYRISYSCNMLMFERLAAIPATLYPPDLRLSIFFIPLKKFLLRIESICFSSEEPSLWKPHVTVWLLPQHHVDNGKLCLECEKLGEGNFFDVWAMSSTSCEIKGPNLNVGKREISVHDEMTSLQSCSISSIDANMACTSNWRYGTYQEGKPVSSSMVISDNYLAPCAIVYGFFNGDIEVVRFNMFFMRLDSHGEGPHQEADACAPKQYLLGHTGAVLCLASHPMMSRSGGCILNHVLLSGSKDCTVRIWDLDTCNPITVLHQHVAPVRQIILPPHRTARPWSDCFLTVGDDSSVALASLETLRVERMFPGHPSYPAKVMWDGVRGYVACFCPNSLEASDALDVLYIWDVKTGARERVLRGAAAHSMFDHFSMVININDPSGIVMNVNTSASSLNFPITEETKFSKSYSKYSGNASSSQNISPVTTRTNEPSTSAASYASKGTAAKSGPPMLSVFQSAKHLIKSSCPFPGIATLSFDLTALMSLCSKPELFSGGIEEKTYVKQAGTDAPKDDAHTGDSSPLKELGSEMHSTYQVSPRSNSVLDWTSVATIEHHEWVRMFEGCLLQFSLSLLHLWNVDHELDNLLVTEMKLKRPDSFIVASGLLGDGGSLTLTFPGSNSTLELWKSSPVYSAMRSLTMVSLAQHLISLSHSCSSASSALAAFYTRKFAEKIPDIKPPLLQVLVSFWQDEFEHVKMAARSLFHCAASRAIPLPLCSPKVNGHTNFVSSPIGIAESEHEDLTTASLISDRQIETQGDFQAEEYEIISWLEPYEMPDWTSCVRGTSQDAMASQIIVAAALAVWYSSLVKPRLAIVVVHPLMKLVMATNEKYSCTAAEILAEGMESTWKACISSEIPRLIADIFFQVECVSGASANASAQNSAASLNIRETLVGILLPSLAMADIPGFLHVIESQIWSTASDSPVHVVSLMTLIRVVRGSPRNLAPYLDKVVTFILQTMDPGNLVMRKTCILSSMAALKEVVRMFPMVALNDTSSRLAVGDAIGDMNNSGIRVYDMQSMSKIKVLDASGPPGLPSLLGGASEMTVTTAITALSFSPDGEGLVAFSENGLMIRWWSLGSVWWEKLSRNLVPVQCTKLIFVPPWEGFSPNSTRSSIMASALGNDRHANSPGNGQDSSEMDRLVLLIHNLDLSYRLEWVGERKVKLTQHGHELGTFQL